MKTFNSYKIQFIIAAFLVFGNQSFAIIRYVKPTATGTGDGSTWGNASADIQAMINASAVSDEVWVASGLYFPQKDAFENASPVNVATKTFLLKNGVKMYGGFIGTETLLSQRNFVTNKTILSGDIDQNDTNTDANNIAEVYTDMVGVNALHVIVSVSDAATTILDGFVITAGKSEPSGFNSQTIEGESVYNSYGGGVNLTASLASISNCIISGNSAYYGGGFHLNNLANSTLTISNTVIRGNYAEYGGGINVGKNTNFTNVMVLSNTADYGGGIYASGFSSNIYNFTNCLFSNNAALSFNGGMELSGVSYNIINSTISKNTSVNGYGGIQVSGNGTGTFKNTIVWGNTASYNPNIQIGSGLTTATNSLLQGSGGGAIWTSIYGTDGGNNLDKNPQFLNDADTDGADNQYFTNDDGFSLTSCSFALNTASNALAPSTDIVGNVRPYNSGIADMGAYEFQANATLPDNATAVSASSNAINCSQTVTLSATCATGTLNWYNSLGATTAVGTGTGLVVTPLVNTTYYAECAVSPACVSLIKTNTGLITVTQRPNPTNIFVSNTSVCPSTSVTLSATCAVGTVNWYNNSTNASFVGGTYTTSISSTRTYTVRCVDGVCQSGAENAPTITVLATPTIIQLSSTTICQGQSINLTSSCATGTLSWYASLTGTTVLGTGNTITVTPTATGSYYAGCSMPGCTSSRRTSSSITVNPTPASPTAVNVDKTVICPSTNVSLSATCATGTITWYNVATGGSAIGTGSPLVQTPSTATTYFASCKLGSCENTRIATSQVLVTNISSNLNLTSNISGTEIHASSNTISATNTIQSTANVKYLASNSITLNPQSGGGFTVNSGAVFEAKILPLTSCN